MLTGLLCAKFLAQKRDLIAVVVTKKKSHLEVI